MRVISLPGPRRPSTAVEPVAASVPRERRDPRRRPRPESVVHVAVPRRTSGALTAVEEAYGLTADRRAVDLYL